jgi:hypothetical protein
MSTSTNPFVSSRPLQPVSTTAASPPAVPPKRVPAFSQFARASGGPTAAFFGARPPAQLAAPGPPAAPKTNIFAQDRDKQRLKDFLQGKSMFFDPHSTKAWEVKSEIKVRSAPAPRLSCLGEPS